MTYQTPLPNRTFRTINQPRTLLQKLLISLNRQRVARKHTLFIRPHRLFDISDRRGDEDSAIVFSETLQREVEFGIGGFGVGKRLGLGLCLGLCLGL